MSLREYLYVDQRRLDSYFEQISDPVKYDKVPVWKTEGSLLGPKVSADQIRFARPYSTHEKIEKLIAHLRETDQVADEPEGDLEHVRAVDRSAYFATSTFTACRYLIRDAAFRDETRDIAVWLDTRVEQSPPTYERSRALCLFEDTRLGDVKPIHVSPVSLLWFLSLESGGKFRQGPRDPYRDIDGPCRGSDETRPDRLLMSLGAVKAMPRRIRCLYRVRIITFRGVVWAYPIFIEALDAT